MTNDQQTLTNEQLEATLKLFPHPLFLAHYGGGDDDYVARDDEDIIIGGTTAEIATAITRLPALAAALLSARAEIAGLRNQKLDLVNALNRIGYEGDKVFSSEGHRRAVEIARQELELKVVSAD